MSWCTSNNLADPTTFQQLDTILVQFFEYMFLENSSRGNRQTCANVRAAVLLRIPAAKYQLNASARALKGWDRLTPSTQRIPCPVGVAWLLAQEFWRRGDHVCACVIVLAFDCYLRVGEVLQLATADVGMPAGDRPGVLRLRETKTGRNQSVVIRSEVVVRMLSTLIEKAVARGSGDLFPISAMTFNRRVSTLILELGLTGLILTAHCFRHGGATEDLIKGLPMRDIIVRGRWRSDRSVENYLQAARALMVNFVTPEPLRSRIAALVSDPSKILR